MTSRSQDDDFLVYDADDGRFLKRKHSIDIDTLVDRKIFYDGGRKVYEWKQSFRKVVVYVEAPREFTRGSPEFDTDIFVNIFPYRLRVGVNGSQQCLIDEETFGEVDVRQSDWFIDGGIITVVLAKKVGGKEWDRALGGREISYIVKSRGGTTDEGLCYDCNIQDEEAADLIKKAYKKIIELYGEEKDTDGYHTDSYDTLPESTHNFLHICPVNSFPFVFALGIATLSLLCLVLVLLNRLSQKSDDNRLVVPEGVTAGVKVAQYCGIFVGVLVEEETPTGILFVRTLSRKSFEGTNLPPHAYTRFVTVCLFRMVMGYLFLFNLFITLVQAESVITIFFDVLALEFVQKLDDNAFILSQKDILGVRLRDAAAFSAGLKFTKRREMSTHGMSKDRKAIGTNDDPGDVSQCRDEASARHKKDHYHFLLRAVYSLNLLLLIAGVTTIGVKQDKGKFQCPTITVEFGSEFWDKPIVQYDSKPGVLLYSYFNGVYEMNPKLKNFDSRYPVYTELNKDLPPVAYKEKEGAMFLYCTDIKSWVFAHQNIYKLNITTANSDVTSSSLCKNWLARSSETTTFDITQIPGDWSFWTGVIIPGGQVSIRCNECNAGNDKDSNKSSDCNYHGQCDGKACNCDPGYQGTHCEFNEPCEVLQEPFKNRPLWRMIKNVTSYGRPIYRREIDPKHKSLYLSAIYAGSQWFVTFERGRINDSYGSEYHAFWDQVFENKTDYVSDFTNAFTPIGVEFKRWASPYDVSKNVDIYDDSYDDDDDDDEIERTGCPWGLLVPIMDVEGQGYFHCSKKKVEQIDMNTTDWSLALGNNPVLGDLDDYFSPTPSPSFG